MITTTAEYEEVSDEIDALLDELRRPRERRAELAEALQRAQAAAGEALQALIEGTGTTAPLQEARSECAALQEAVAVLDGTIGPLEARLASAEKAHRASGSLDDVREREEAAREREERTRYEAFRYDELRRAVEAAKAARERHDEAFRRNDLDALIEASEEWVGAHHAFMAAAERFEIELNGDFASLVYDTPSWQPTRELRMFLQDLRQRGIYPGAVLHPRLLVLGGVRTADGVYDHLDIFPCMPKTHPTMHGVDLERQLQARLR